VALFSPIKEVIELPPSDRKQKYSIEGFMFRTSAESIWLLLGEFFQMFKERASPKTISHKRPSKWILEKTESLTTLSRNMASNVRYRTHES